MVLRRRAWLLSVGLAMLLLVQAAWTRRHIPKLRAARGPRCGQLACAGARLNLLVVGEPSVAGVGVTDLSEGLAAQIARELHERLHRTIQWHAIGRPGATVRAIHPYLTGHLTPSAQQFRADVAVCAFGVNDSLRLRGPWQWRCDVSLLLRALQCRHGCRLIVLSPVPPLWQFRSLPLPLRAVLGMQAFMLDWTLRRIAEHQGDVLYVPIRLRNQRELLARDGFHPSGTGYRIWAAELARTIADAPVPDDATADLKLNGACTSASARLPH